MNIYARSSRSILLFPFILKKENHSVQFKDTFSIHNIYLLKKINILILLSIKKLIFGTMYVLFTNYIILVDETHESWNKIL